MKPCFWSLTAEQRPRSTSRPPLARNGAWPAQQQVMQYGGRGIQTHEEFPLTDLRDQRHGPSFGGPDLLRRHTSTVDRSTIDTYSARWFPFANSGRSNGLITARRALLSVTRARFRTWRRVSGSSTVDGASAITSPSLPTPHRWRIRPRRVPEDQRAP